MTPGPRALIPHIQRFRAYRKAHKDWGPLYLVMDRRATQDECVAFCRNLAETDNDTEAVALADMLIGLSQQQRRKLAQLMVKPPSRRTVLVKEAQ